MKQRKERNTMTMKREKERRYEGDDKTEGKED